MSLENASSWECRVSVQCERVKEEWEEEYEGRVKEEPGLEPEASAACGERQERGGRPVKQEPDEAGLYADHEVKDELVLGPTVLQPPDAALASAAARKNAEHSGSPPAVESGHSPAGGPRPGASCRDQLRQTQVRSGKKQNKLKKTVLAYTDEKPYKCEICLKQFSRNSTLLGHKLIHLGEKPFKCEICLKQFSDKSNLKAHAVVHTCLKEYECDICQKQFSRKSRLVVHIRRHGRLPAWPPCAICGARFERRECLLRHAWSHIWSPEDPGSSLEACRSDEKRTGSLAAEECGRSPAGGPRPGASCGDQPRLRACSVRLERLPPHEEKRANSTTLSTSVKSHTNHEIQPKGPPEACAASELYSCDTCGEQFARKRSLIRHIHLHTNAARKNAEHSGSPPAEESGHSPAGGPRPGASCGDQLQQSQVRSAKKQNKVIKTVLAHTGEKPYKCEICLKQFSFNSYFIVHNRIHTGEQPYKCKVCLKQFSIKSSLNKHAVIHTGEKPYKCEICLKQFSRSTYLRIHKRLHTGEKPYKCETCLKQFSHKSQLNTHAVIHTGEKRYKCEICLKQFSFKSCLHKHAVSHTWERLFPETEGFMLAIQDQVIETRNDKKYITNTVSTDACRKCNSCTETIQHITGACKTIAQTDYKHRHDQVANIIHQKLALQHQLISIIKPYYQYTPKTLLENSTTRLLYFDRAILTDRTIHYNRPDITLINKAEKTAFLIDIAVLNTHNLQTTIAETLTKYIELKDEIMRIWHIQNVTIVPIVLSSTGFIPEQIHQSLKTLKLPQNTCNLIQKEVIQNTCRIVRKFLQTDQEPSTLTPSTQPSPDQLTTIHLDRTDMQCLARAYRYTGGSRDLKD